MAWFYEIRDSNKTVAGAGKGYATQTAAMTAGRKKARELKATGSLLGDGVATVRAELHQIAGRPSKENLTLVFGKAGYLLTWPKRTEKFGITPETFQAALAAKMKETKG
jgi:hypothetical protein